MCVCGILRMVNRRCDTSHLAVPSSMEYLERHSGCSFKLKNKRCMPIVEQTMTIYNVMTCVIIVRCVVFVLLIVRLFPQFICLVYSPVAYMSNVFVSCVQMSYAVAFCEVVTFNEKPNCTSM